MILTVLFIFWRNKDFIEMNHWVLNKNKKTRRNASFNQIIFCSFVVMLNTFFKLKKQNT